MQKNPDVSDLMSECDSEGVVHQDFDTYTSQHIMQESTEWGVAIVPYLDNCIGSRVKATDISRLNEFLSDNMEEVRGQVQEQMDIAEDNQYLGQYYDCDTDNSSFDILADISKIQGLFFEESPLCNGYKNDLQENYPGIINLEIEQGEWATGETYRLDVIDEVTKKIQGVVGDNSSGGNEIA